LARFAVAQEQRPFLGYAHYGGETVVPLQVLISRQENSPARGGSLDGIHQTVS
jgi:hypothetical protein